jgi:predicted metalloendopeptidase
MKRKNHNKYANKQVEEMISLIMNELRKTLEHEPWLSDATKIVANEKITSMEVKIGFPDFLNNVTLVDEMYSSYEITPNNYFRTKFQFCERQQQESLSKLGKKVDRKKWVTRFCRHNQWCIYF